MGAFLRHIGEFKYETTITSENNILTYIVMASMSYFPNTIPWFPISQKSFLHILPVNQSLKNKV